MSDNTKKVIIAILGLMLIGLSVFWYFDHNKQVDAIDTLSIEKEEIIAELTKLEDQYNIAITQKTELAKVLEVQKNNIIRFKDSLKNIKNTNWKLIKFYKNKIVGLSTISDKMLRINDSLVNRNKLLNQENQDLYEDKNELTTNLDEQSKFNDTLVKQNLDLAKKVAIGQIIKVNNFKVTTYDERKNGDYRESVKARRVDVFKTSFLINENLIAKEKDIIVFVSIVTPSGEVLNKKGKFITTDNKTIYFSDRTIIPFKTKAVPTDMILKSDDKLEKGLYKTYVYIDNKQMAVIETILK